MQKLWRKYTSHKHRGLSKHLFYDILPTGKYAQVDEASFFLLMEDVDCSIVLLRDTNLPSGYGIVMQQGSPLKKHIDHE